MRSTTCVGGLAPRSLESCRLGASGVTRPAASAEACCASALCCCCAGWGGEGDSDDPIVACAPAPAPARICARLRAAESSPGDAGGMAMRSVGESAWGGAPELRWSAAPEPTRGGSEVRRTGLSLPMGCAARECVVVIWCCAGR